MIDQIITGVYLLIILAVGIYAGRKVKTMEDFSVAGRNMPFYIIFATLSASFIGGGFSMGNAEKVFLFGIANIFALFGFSLKEILVAKFIAPRMYNYSDCITVGDIIGNHYGKAAKMLTGVLSLIVCAGILGAQIGAIGYIFNVFLGIDVLYGIIIGCGIVILYSTIGGMKSVVITDVIQFIVLVIGIPLVLIFGVYHAGGWTNVINAVPDKHLSIFGNMPVMAFVSLFLTFLVGETLVPPYMQRLLISKDTKALQLGTMLSGLLSIVFFSITGLIGLVAYALFPTVDANLAMPHMIMTILPIGVKGIVIAGVISIVMSSADSFLNSAAVAAVNDIVKPIFRDSEKAGALWIARLFTVIVGLGAVLFAINIKSVLDILLYSYNFWAPIILVPLIAALFDIKATKGQFFASALAGALGVYVWKFILPNQYNIDGLLVGLLASFLVFTYYAFFEKHEDNPPSA